LIFRLNVTGWLLGSIFFTDPPLALDMEAVPELRAEPAAPLLPRLPARGRPAGPPPPGVGDAAFLPELLLRAEEVDEAAADDVDGFPPSVPSIDAAERDPGRLCTPSIQGWCVPNGKNISSPPYSPALGIWEASEKHSKQKQAC
jgi:hypothetical protein